MFFIGTNKLIKTFTFSIILLIIFLILKSLYYYNELKVTVENDVKKEAQVLTDYMMSMRNIYQKQFLKSGIELNHDTLGFLPAHATSLISDKFTTLNKHNFYIRNVSDNPRNIKNLADKQEQKAIDFFNKNKKEEYFEKYNDKGTEYYQFASPIYIEKYCLKCHGKKVNTFPLIKETYDNRAYNYKEGDLRGIVSIKIPTNKVEKRVAIYLEKELIYFIIILFLISALLYTIYKRTNSIMKHNNKLAENYAMSDSLTGLNNRHYLKSIDLDEYGNQQYFIVFFDIDHFKKVNDTYGHACGDYILKEFSKELKRHAREKDVLCRYGGEEFILIINDIDEKTLFSKLEEIRILIASKIFVFNSQKINITTSIGYSESKKSLSFETILIRADKALYKAKKNGRNKIKKSV